MLYILSLAYLIAFMANMHIALVHMFNVELDNMVDIVPFNTAGKGPLGFWLLGNGGSDGCGDFV
jgi:hypothetical protein